MNKTDEKDQAVHLPPVYNNAQKHAVFPDVSQDEKARFNFLTALQQHLASTVELGNKAAFDKRVKLQSLARTGRDFKTPEQVGEAMSQDLYYQMWSALQRSAQEMIQQAGRSVVLRQIENLVEKVKQYNAQRPETLSLDPSLVIPHYLTRVDHQCMPGGYHTEYIADDVTNAAVEEITGSLEIGKGSGLLSDGKGYAVVDWLKKNYPDFKPKRILDIGCGIGNNTLPLAVGYPEAEVVGIDASAVALRYAHARATALKTPNVRFVQANAETLPVDNGSFDWVQSTMFLHTTSASAINAVVRETYRVLTSGGLMLHVCPAPYPPGTSLFEQFMGNWETFNNNEPFLGVVHKMDQVEWMKSAGFLERNLLQFGLSVASNNDNKSQSLVDHSYGHGVLTTQNAFGAWKE